MYDSLVKLNFEEDKEVVDEHNLSTVNQFDDIQAPEHDSTHLEKDKVDLLHLNEIEPSIGGIHSNNHQMDSLGQQPLPLSLSYQEPKLMEHGYKMSELLLE